MPFLVFSHLNVSQKCTSVNFEIWIYLYRYFWLEPQFEVGKLEVAGDVFLFSTVTWNTVVWACQTGSVWCLLSLCLPAWQLSKLFKWSYFEEKEAGFMMRERNASGSTIKSALKGHCCVCIWFHSNIFCVHVGGAGESAVLFCGFTGAVP